MRAKGQDWLQPQTFWPNTMIRLYTYICMEMMRCINMKLVRSADFYLMVSSQEMPKPSIAENRLKVT